MAAAWSAEQTDRLGWRRPEPYAASNPAGGALKLPANASLLAGNSLIKKITDVRRDATQSGALCQLPRTRRGPGVGAPRPRSLVETRRAGLLRSAPRDTARNRLAKRHSKSSARNRGAARGWSRERRWPASGRVIGCGRRRGSV